MVEKINQDEVDVEGRILAAVYPGLVGLHCTASVTNIKSTSTYLSCLSN